MGGVHHQDVRFTAEIARGVDAELEALASWLGLESVERDEAARALASLGRSPAR